VTLTREYWGVKTLTPVITCQLPEFLDSAAVSELRGHAALHPSAYTLIVEADQVCRFDPVGVLRLWDFCIDQSLRGIRVQLVNLHPALAHRLRAHPLLNFINDEDRVFLDPFGTFEASRR
jgi:hypothetical protein